MNWKFLHSSVFVSEHHACVRFGGGESRCARAQMRVCLSLYVCTCTLLRYLAHALDTPERLCECCPPPREPQTHAETHTTSFSLSFILFFVSPHLSLLILSLKKEMHVFFLWQISPTQLQRYYYCVVYHSITADLPLSNAFTHTSSGRRLCNDYPFSQTPFPHYPTIRNWLDMIVPYANLNLNTPFPCLPPLPPLCLLPGRGWCQSGRPWGLSDNQWAVTGSSSASLSLQSGARWGLVREPSLPKWP